MLLPRFTVKKRKRRRIRWDFHIPEKVTFVGETPCNRAQEATETL